ncbi:MAG: class I SAM-dependent methyltransferase [Christensenellales bacterium]|jgi:S-adenosylmethionine-dependent methyltransferase
MTESVSTVRAYYDENAQHEWERLDRHPFEFALTTYMMDRYIRPGDRVLDIGGGPGRYSLYFARKGCDVTLIDLSSGNVALAKEKAKELGVTITATARNCLEIEELNLGEFDHVFLMGPLYHLIEEEDRVQAVRIAMAHLKQGGILYCSFIMDFGGIIYNMKNGPGLLPEDLKNPAALRIFDSVITREGYAGGAFTDAFFINQHRIEPFMAQFGLEKLHLFGQEGILAPNENQIMTYPEEEQAMWIDLAKRYLELPELLAFSEHAMFIGRK